MLSNEQLHIQAIRIQVELALVKHRQVTQSNARHDKCQG